MLDNLVKLTRGNHAASMAVCQPAATLTGMASRNLRKNSVAASEVSNGSDGGGNI